MKTRKLSSITSIFYHHSLSPDVSAKEIEGWHKKRGFEEIGYHRVYRNDGEIEHGRQLGYMGAHALGMNRGSLGACFTGNFYFTKPTRKQIASASADYVSLCKKLNTHLKIKFHRTKKNPCPGPNFNREAFMAKLNMDWIRTSAEYQKFKNKVVMIAESKPVENLREEIVLDMLEHAENAIKKYDPIKNVEAGKKGSIDGAIASAVAVSTFAAVKGVVSIEDPAIENAVSGLISTAVTAFIAFVGNRIRNWMKNK